MNIKLDLKLDKATRPLLNVLRILAEHLFLASLVMMLISSILGAAAFYKYYVLIRDTEPELRFEPIKFEEATYLKIIEDWQQRDDTFDNALNKQYPNLLIQPQLTEE